MQLLFITVPAAVLPALLALAFFHAKDRFPEPPRVVWATFALGVLSVIPVLMVALPIAMLVENLPSGVLYATASAFLVAAMPEEYFKYRVVKAYSANHSEFDEPMDGLVYGVAASLGFAALENVLYVLDGGLSVAIARALTSIPCHAGLGAIMGYYVGLAKFAPEHERRSLLWRAYWVPVLLHGLYDFPLMLIAEPNFDESTGVVLALAGAAIFVLALTWIWAVRLARKLRNAQRRRPVLTE
jgi:RsiW-degrading membrane proteinase PrsW (M82 family)